MGLRSTVARTGRRARKAITSDGQVVFVGYDCAKRIAEAEVEGYQPPRGGPRLWIDHYAPQEALDAAGIVIIRSVDKP